MPAKKTTKKPATTKLTDEEKLWAASAYVIFFLPLLTVPKSSYAKFHANQGFTLFLLGAALFVVGSIVTLISFGLLSPLVMIAWLLVFVLAVMGAIAAFNGEKKRLPVIGNKTFLKL
jgi:uncharacterized membrane protein